MAIRLKKITKRLGELLVEKHLVTEDQLQLALADQKKNGGLIGEILVGWGYTTEEAIVQALASQYHFPYLPSTLYKPSDEAIRLIPKETAVRYSIVALDHIGKILTVAMSNPMQIEVLDEIEQKNDCEVAVFLTTYTEIMRTIERHYQFQKPGST